MFGCWVEVQVNDYADWGIFTSFMIFNGGSGCEELPFRYWCRRIVEKW